MKKYFLFALVLFSLISCDENIKFNDPAFQGMKDNVFWRALESKATIEAGGALTIEAYVGYEKVTLKTSSAAAQTYTLGVNNSNTATYDLLTAEGTTIFYSGAGVGNGEIVITEYDAANNTISGNFKFNLENASNDSSAGSILNFQNGVFYKVPIVSK